MVQMTRVPMFVLIANTSKTMSPEFEQIIIEQQVSNVHLKMYLISFPGWENEQDPIWWYLSTAQMYMVIKAEVFICIVS